MTIERKSAAIMFTDIAGYTEAMSQNEQKALKMLRKKRSIIKPLIGSHNGTYVKEIGDGTLSYFESGFDASACAKELQKQIQENKLKIRVGIHIGDIVFDEEDVYGDGVNIASRIESLAPIGGVLISKNVYDELINKEGFEGVHLGLQSLKGVGRLVDIYAIKDEYLVIPKVQDFKKNEIKVHVDDETPSIAIIPFENKGAEEDIFYAYGISQDLISDCSGAGLIRVASLKDVEKFDYSKMETSELSEKLLTRYIAQGTLWKMGDLFQLSIELYDTKDKKVVWSDRWQEKWDNLPTIKSSLSDGLLKALDTKPKTEQKSNVSTNPEAYELYLKGRYKYLKRVSREDTEIARGLIRKAIELDSNLLLAKNLLGSTFKDMGNYDEAMKIYTSSVKQAEDLDDKPAMANSLNNIGSVHNYKSDYDTAIEFYNKALLILKELDDKRGMGNTISAIGIAYYNQKDMNQALHFNEKALLIQEELDDKAGMALSINAIGLVHADKGYPDKALEFYNRALSIRKEIGDKPSMGINLITIGRVYLNRGDIEKSLDFYSESLSIHDELGDKHGMLYSLSYLGHALYEKGDYDLAIKNINKQLKIANDIGVKAGVSDALFRIGVSYAYLKDYHQAVEYLEKSISAKTDSRFKYRELFTQVILNICFKHLNRINDLNDFDELLKENDDIQFELNLGLYNLLEDESYLEKAYHQLQQNVLEMDEELGQKFLNYPIPKEIIEKWSKIK